MNEDIKRRLCELTIECKEKWYFGNKLIPRDDPGSDHLDSCDCKGTGCISLLDPELVRVPCSCKGGWRGMRLTISCVQCGGQVFSKFPGRGWNPVDDPWAYVQAALEALPKGDDAYYLRTEVETAFKLWLWESVWDDDPGEAVLKAVAGVLLECGSLTITK